MDIYGIYTIIHMCVHFMQRISVWMYVYVVMLEDCYNFFP